MNALARFDRFLLESSEADQMHSEFTAVLRNTTLKRSEPLTQLLLTHKKVSGLYFWLARHETREYKIYVGQTNSLANRLINYVSDFQAHSPNDYKLRVFSAFLMEVAPGAVLDLHFSPMDVHDLKTAEKQAIKKYKPLLNQLPPASEQARESLKNAFDRYYRSSFEMRLEPTEMQIEGDGPTA